MPGFNLATPRTGRCPCLSLARKSTTKLTSIRRKPTRDGPETDPKRTRNGPAILPNADLYPARVPVLQRRVAACLDRGKSTLGSALKATRKRYEKSARKRPQTHTESQSVSTSTSADNRRASLWRIIDGISATSVIPDAHHDNSLSLRRRLFCRLLRPVHRRRRVAPKRRACCAD